MLKVHRTDTDEIVLIHEPTQTVVVGDSFDAAYEKLRDLLGERLADPLTPPPKSADGRDAAKPTVWARYGLLAVLVALPFVWIGVLHVSLGSLVVELRRTVSTSAKAKAKEAKDEPTLREDLDALGRRVDRLIDDVSKLKRESKKPAKKAPAEIPEDDEDDDESPDDKGKDGAEETKAE